MENESTVFTHKRIESLDALRGFDMFMILGADSLAMSIKKATDSPTITVIASQLDHVEWEGFYFYDLVFPLFIFLMGASVVFSLSKKLEEGDRRSAYTRVIKRSLLLYGLGLLYYGALSRGDGPEMFRYVGVLQRIALCYLFGGLLFINLKPRGLIAVCAALLVGYWAVMTFVPVPGVGAGNFEEGKNLANYIDAQYLPGYKWDGDWDPEGLLSTIPAVASGLLGIFAGLLIRRQDLTDYRKVAWLAAIGAACLAAGYLWGMQFPIIKKLWTSSFVLVAGGWSFLLLALFYLVIDVWNVRTWSRPFVWIGMNCIAIYILNKLIGGFDSLLNRVIHEPAREAIAPYGDMVVVVLGLMLSVAVCRYLYRRNLFVRI